MTYEPRGEQSGPFSADPSEWISAAQTWLAEAAEGAHGGLSTGSAECGICPVCRLIAALRAADPAVVSTVVEAGAGAALAAIEVLREAGEKLLAAQAGSGVPPTDTSDEEAP